MCQETRPFFASLQNIVLTNADLLFFLPLGTNFSEIKMQITYTEKMLLKMSLVTHTHTHTIGGIEVAQVAQGYAKLFIHCQPLGMSLWPSFNIMRLKLKRGSLLALHSLIRYYGNILHSGTVPFKLKAGWC